MLFYEILQAKETGVVIDFTDPTTVYDNVKQVDCYSANSI